MRTRLRLNLGLQVELGDEVPSQAGGRAFSGTWRETSQPVVVTVFRAPPDGPDAAAMRLRLAELRQLDHAVLVSPVSNGDVDGRCWVIEPVSPLPTALERLEDGLLPLKLAVSAIRDLARALAAIHRRGRTHGAIGLHTVRIGSAGALLGGLGESLGGSVRGDLDALGFVAWALLSGEVEQSSARSLSKLRRGVPASLDALCASFCARNAANRPQRAEAILEVLDAIPSRRHHALASIVDSDWNDGRPTRPVRWLVVGAAIVLLVLLLSTRT